MADRTLAVTLRQHSPIPLDVGFTCGAGDVLANFRAIRKPGRRGLAAASPDCTGRNTPASARARCSDRYGDGVFALHIAARSGRLSGLRVFPIDGRGQRDHRARTPAPWRTAFTRLATAGAGAPVGTPESPTSALSGGEASAWTLARRWRGSGSPLLDEPFAAVDRTVRRHLQDEIDALRRTLDIPLILVTHDFDDVVRLATHLLILEQGRGVACGPLRSLMSRPDLSWLREAVGLGSLFDAVVTHAHTSRGLVELMFDGGTLLASEPSVSIGTEGRGRYPAREVILPRGNTEGLSSTTHCPATVSAIIPTGFRCMDRANRSGRGLLLAEVTRDAVARWHRRGNGLHADQVCVDRCAQEPKRRCGDRG